MERRDYLMKQIEELGRVLASLFERGKSLPYSSSIEELQRTFQDEFDIDLLEILNRNEIETDFRLLELGFSEQQFYSLLDHLIETSNKAPEDEQRVLLKNILCHADEYDRRTATFSMYRSSKIKRYRSLLQ